ncbi:hypothetical protein [Sutcliffiella rhizosphaerae]|uniref:Uncharacterized protein n=1 Tax=Sutcliffiella rhizosphaerae TaxID=2880967 RepID=A0ABM8YRV3_9BACI|nr:hypothetical protein [Sutcliffiella rhizosphaerae]CAG9622686.1 hypothetical protein BACCIP111883_03477 [Sutcliffiella rhizosphaerae]
MRKLFIYLFGILLVISVIVSIVPVTISPSNDTRVILEHNYNTFIAPQCFEQADVTNFLEEATLGKATELGYNEESMCTKEAFKPLQKPIIVKALIKMNLISSPWD